MRGGPKPRPGRQAASIRLALIGAAFLVSLPAPAVAVYAPLEEIPVEDRLYQDLESLALRYDAGIHFLSLRPWSRGEARSFLEQVRKEAPEAAQDPSFRRIERQVIEDAKGSAAPLFRQRSGSQRLEVAPYLRLGYREDRTLRPAVDRDYRTGLAASLGFSDHWLVFVDWYAGTASSGPHGTPDFGTRFALLEGVDYSTWLDRAYVVYESAALRAYLGRSWLRWGSGVTGTLAVSDAAPAFERVSFDADLLRRARLSWYVGSLDAVTGQYVAGHRLSLRLSDAFEVGLAEEARFDGLDQFFYYFIPVFPYSFIEKRVAAFTSTSDTTNKFTKNNAMTSFDFRVRLARGLGWYGEILVDDLSVSSTFKPRQMAWQSGFHWTRPLAPGRLLNLRGEYTRVYNYTYSVWHRHDFSLGGMPLGYALGPDAEQLWGSASYDIGAAWQWGVEGASIRKGEGRLGQPWLPASGKVDNIPLSGTVQRTQRVSAYGRFEPTARLAIEASAGFVREANADHVAGADRSEPNGSVRVRARF